MAANDSIGELVKQLSEQTSRLARTKAQLANADLVAAPEELREEIERTRGELGSGLLARRLLRR